MPLEVDDLRFTEDEVAAYIQRRGRLQSSASVNGRTVVSTATLEVHMDKSYAINSWVVDT